MGYNKPEIIDLKLKGLGCKFLLGIHKNDERKIGEEGKVTKS